MIYELIEDLAKLTLIVASLYFALGAYAHRKQPKWFEPLKKRRLAILLGLSFAVSAIKVSEDALTGESGPIDRAILLFIHHHVPGTLTGFFEAITLTASTWVLFSLSTVVALALWFTKHRFEAWLMAVSMTGAAVVIYVVKILAVRTRPALWDTEWYWGSSFPSGHTLAVATFSTAAVLCTNRIRSTAGLLSLSIAILWIFLVALSRLVLGAHWPTDVLVAACIGVFLPLTMNVVHELRQVRER